MMPRFPYRVSLKGLIFDADGNVLVVKEAGRDYWELPGGGMEHGESVHQALARELYEEVGLTDEFDHKIIAVDDPHLLESGAHQIRLVFHVTPAVLPTMPGTDGDEIAYVDPRGFENAEHMFERSVYRFWSESAH